MKIVTRREVLEQLMAKAERDGAPTPRLKVRYAEPDPRKLKITRLRAVRREA